MGSSTKEPGIRALYKPKAQEEEALTLVYRERYEAMKTSPDRVKAAATWEKSEKQWESWREEKAALGKEIWQSNHVVPMTFAAVETAQSEMIDQNLIPIILPRGDEDVPRARVMQHIFNYTLDISDFDLAMFDITHDALIKGTAIAQEYYWQDRRLVYNTVLDTKNKEKETQVEVMDYDDVITEPVRLEDFFIDERARGFRGPYGARDCIRRYIMHIDDFKSFFKGDTWDPMGRAQFVKPGGDTNYWEFFKPPEGIDKGKEVEVLWYWSKPKDRLIIVANDVVVKLGPNPFKHKQLPFARAVDTKRTHRFYGKGVPETLESTQDESDTMRQMTIDRSHLDIDKMFMVSSRLSLSDEDLIARPHGMIPVDDVNGAKAVEYGDVPRSVEMSLKHLEDDATISTGINPRAQSMPTAGSATEAAILKESTLKRIRVKVWLMRKLFMIDMARLRVANILQHYPEPRMEEIVGDAGSEDYRREVEKLKARGLLVEENGKTFKQSYRRISVKDAQLEEDAAGKLQEKSYRGYSFFDLQPKYFVPENKLGYMIKFDASTNIQISKALQQSKDLELYDRVSQIALQVPNSYDIVKMTDDIIRSYDKDPYNWKPDQVQQSDMEQRIGMLIDLAGVENKMLMQGKPVPATPMASVAHTRIHVEFMHGPEFQKLPNDSPIVQQFVDHVMGEITAQESRGMGGGAGMGAGGGMGGGGQAPDVTRGGMANGKMNRPGGMAQPANKMGDILPGLNNGGNKNL